MKNDVIAAQDLVPRLWHGLSDGRTLSFDFPQLRIGIAEYEEGPTGCTVLHVEGGADCEVDVRGGAPGLLGGYPRVDAVSLAGGSLYGLEAATGVTSSMLAERGGHVDVRIGVVSAENRQARDHVGIEIGVHVERRANRNCRLQFAKPAQEFAFAIFMRGRDHRPMQIEQDPVEDPAPGRVEDQSHDPLVGLGFDQPARARFGDHGHRDLAAFAIGHFEEAAHSRARAAPGCCRGVTDERGVAVAEKPAQRRRRGREGVRFMLEAGQEQAKGGFVIH